MPGNINQKVWGWAVERQRGISQIAGDWESGGMGLRLYPATCNLQTHQNFFEFSYFLCWMRGVDPKKSQRHLPLLMLYYPMRLPGLLEKHLPRVSLHWKRECKNANNRKSQQFCSLHLYLNIYLPVLLIGSSFLKREACGPARLNAHAAAASPVYPPIWREKQVRLLKGSQIEGCSGTLC